MPPNNRALVWAPESEQDLLDIWHYLAEAVGTDTADRQLYVVFYRVATAAVEIVRVLHQRRDIGAIFGER